MKFQGKSYILMGAEETGFAMMTPEQFKEYLDCDCGLEPLLNPPFAFVRDREIRRWGKTIGFKQELEFIREITEEEL